MVVGGLGKFWHFPGVLAFGAIRFGPVGHGGCRGRWQSCIGMAVPLGRPGASAGPGRDGFGPTAGLPRPRARPGRGTHARVGFGRSGRFTAPPVRRPTSPPAHGRVGRGASGRPWPARPSVRPGPVGVEAGARAPEAPQPALEAARGSAETRVRSATRPPRGGVRTTSVRRVPSAGRRAAEAVRARRSPPGGSGPSCGRSPRPAGGRW